MPTTKVELAELSITQLRELTGKSRETITKRLEGKLQPIRRDGRTIYYDPKAALPLIYCLENLDPAQELARLNRAKSEAQEMKNLESRRELVSAEDVRLTWSTRIVMVKTRIRAIHAQAAARIPGVTPQIAMRLRDLLERTLIGLADDDDGDDRDESGGADLAPRSGEL